MANFTIKPLNQHAEIAVPGFGQIDFGVAADGKYSTGYKMIAFEPGKILQAQELNEMQFRMSTHQMLSTKMVSNWISTIVFSGSTETTGPGWDGATPIDASLVKLFGTSIRFYNGWYLCKANSSGLFFWLYLYEINSGYVPVETIDIPVNSYIGFELNTTANGTYTGELVTCSTVGDLGNHELSVKNTSTCGSSRYYLEIVNVIVKDSTITNSFVPIAQKRADGIYFLNNIKVESAV
jgi:hypothetical protein